MPKNSHAPADDAFTLPALTAAFAAGVEGALPLPENQRAFLARVLEDLRRDELPGAAVADLACVLGDFWRFATAALEAAPADASPAVRLIRARGEGGRDLAMDVLEIVQPDAPFLVDSVMGEIGESGAGVKAMFHPIVDHAGERVSLIQVWLAPVGEERRAGLIDRVLT
ncbi:MAG: hypothetical protein ACR2FH_05015, partial [Caulobacteraceae bacterium]